VGKSKVWWNITGDDAWDDYYKAWAVMAAVLLIPFLLIVGIAIFNTYVRGI
jgi:uncharacterized membrane protein YjgN (DUF898 family)